MSGAAMPSDWSDQQGWEQYYASLYPNGSYDSLSCETGSISLRNLPNFVDDLKTQQITTIWVSGCGVSLLPKLLAQAGFTVHATDISRTAVDFQQHTDDATIELLLENAKIPFYAAGSLASEVHDFRQPYLKTYFDLIINVKAFQGFDQATMEQVAHSHFQALKPSHEALSDTLNVQGKRRDILEESLVNAGFFIPFYDLNRWYRSALRETHIPHIFVLGQPMIPRTGVYEQDHSKWQQDAQILRAVAMDYHQRQQVEIAAEQKRLNESREVRLATVIYSTG